MVLQGFGKCVEKKENTQKREMCEKDNIQSLVRILKSV